jgi:serine/threonine protein kinase/TolA-binding protein
MTGQMLSHYRVLETVGQGASGVIYKAEDLSLRRLVALKCLPPDLPANTSAGLRFQHEARTASGINHPNICTIHEIGEHEGRQFIVMEWLDGRPLAAVIDRRPLKLETLLDYAIQIADGLAAAHGEGIVHRDIKPSNIVITSNDQVKIVDFGISLLMPARQLDASLQSPAGTAPYMSPEQALGEPLDSRSDLFSFGSVLYEMSTGRRPFVAGAIQEITQSIVDRIPDPPRLLNPNIPDELDRIITKALEKNRKLRFQTACELRVDLQRLKRDFDSGALRSTVRTSAAPLPVQARHGPRAWLKTGPVTVAGAAVSLVLMLGLIATVRPTSQTTDSAEGVSLIEPGPRRHGDIVLEVEDAPTVRRSATSTVSPPQVQNVDALSNQIPTLPVRTDIDSMSQELGIVRRKADAGLHDQALESLRTMIPRYRTAPEAVEAYFLMGAIQQTGGKYEDAMGTYLEIVDRYAQHGHAAEALFRYAEATLKSSRRDKHTTAREALHQAATKYPHSVWTPQALILKANIEDRRRLTEWDADLATSIPAALATYRQLARAYPKASETEMALGKLAKMYDDVNRFDLAATAYVELATGYPATSSEAWYQAAELYRRRLKDSNRARAAYANVPEGSRHFKAAQKYLR